MPDWIKSDEEYDAPSRKNNYITKNLYKFCNLIMYLKNEHINSNINKVSGLCKIISLILFVCCIVCSYDILSLWICGLFIFAELCFNRGAFISKVIKNSIKLSIFPFLVFLPYAILNFSNVVVIYYIKIFFIMIVVNIFISSTTVYEMSNSLKRIHFPNVIIFIVDIMIKYLNIITYVIHDILQAIIMRTVGKEKDKYNTIGGLFANVIFKSKRCGEDLYQAMECRGFTEKYVESKVETKLSKEDIIFILVNCIFLIIYLCVRSY